MWETDPTKRFSNRVENYIKYRPRYPAAVLELMRTEMGLTRRAVIADIGSGTGLLSELFMAHGNLVLGVEPNKEMRTAAETLFAGYPAFRSVAGAAEATTLDAHSVDFVVAGQAFHWFDADRAKCEFARILKPSGFALFTWNWRDTNSTPFARAYEVLCRRVSDEYEKLKNLKAIEAALKTFFSPGGYQRRSFDNAQKFDFEGFKGRVLSSSYMPTLEHPKYAMMLDELRCLFDEYQVANRVRMDYQTLVYYGRPM